ncbi:hypothetical protein [Sphingomonas sp. BK235]|uniref:hypothetical protein n=1 Tax=Sphingomonas sp. BK235 TaxID=2512131 RepID=UPI00104B2A0F|nr:hypothetical protein [Sphingomonas sp. BK235]TCP36555.1 hypothetical protein EV292_10151 [Sphingomonas sp. BK235]
MTPIVSTVAVYRKATGELVHLTTADLAPAAGDPLLGKLTLPAGYNEQTWVWNAATKAFAEDPARVEAVLVAQVKDTAESKKMGFLSAGGAKKAEYAQKAAEVSFYDSLGGSVIAILAAVGALTPAQRRAKFGYALADAAAFGDTTITNAIERFRSGMAASDKVPSIAAAEAKGCAAIKDATTVAAKRTAYAAIDWNWKA